MNSIDLVETHTLEEDFYCILGCHDSSSVEQILAEYKHKALLLHPDKNQDFSSKQNFQKLQEAKEVLCNPEKRKDYDKWKTSGLAISYKQWSAMKTTNAVFHWATPKGVEGRMVKSSISPEEHVSLSNHLPPRNASTFHISYNSILSKFRNYEI